MLGFELNRVKDLPDVLKGANESELPAAIVAGSELPDALEENLIWIAVPVRKAGEPLGLVVGLLSSDKVLSVARQELEFPNAELRLQDEPATPTSLNQASRVFEFGGRSWTLELRLPSGPEARPRWGIPIGLTVVSILQFFFILVSNRTIRIEQLNREIENRAETLRSANRQLERATVAATEANLAKGLFLANMSHEVRTPMNAILGLTHLVLESDLKPAQREYLRQVELSAEALLALLNSISDFSKIESGEMTLNPQPHSLGLLMEESVRTVILQAEKRGLDVFVNLEPSLPNTVLVDAHRLRQILVNLLGNAVKFTEQGEVELSCKGREERKGRFRFDFAVRDTGIGIPDPQLQSIFEAFTQGEAASSSAHVGTGLGLAITSKLLELMDSAVQVESRRGDGSVFSISLALEVGEESLEAFPESVIPSELPVYPNLTNCRRLQIMTDQLTAWGFPIVDSSEDARIHVLDEEVFDFTAPPARPTVLMLRLSELIRSMERCEKTGATPLVRPVSRTTLQDALLRALKVSTSVSLGHSRHKPYLGLSALVADDSYTNRLLASATLQRLGFRVVQVENGERALRAFKAGKFDLVLMDLRMPVMDGYRAARLLREAAPEAIIVGATAQGAGPERQHAMDAILVKPYSENELRRCLAPLLPPRYDDFNPEVLMETAGQDAESARAVASSFLDELPGLV